MQGMAAQPPFDVTTAPSSCAVVASICEAEHAQGGGPADRTDKGERGGLDGGDRR